MRKIQRSPKIDFRAPVDTTRVNVSLASPPEKSIYANPVTMNNEVRTPTSDQVRSPATKQVGADPSMQLKRTP